MADRSIQISVTLADAAAQKALGDFISKGEKADDSMQKLNKSGSSAFDQISLHIGKAIDSFDIFKGSLAANLVTKSFDLIVGAVSNVIGSFGKMVDEAKLSEVSINNLNIALKNAGLFSKANSKDLQDFAEHLQSVTTYSDDAVLSSESLLLTLTNLDKNGIKQATQAAVDLAASLNIDLHDATEMIAKAVNGNTQAFHRQGIEIKSGADTAERFANVLAALSTQTGAAAAKTQTYQGAQDKLNNAQNDFLKSAGKLFTQNEAVVKSINLLAESFISAAEWINKNQAFLSDLGKTIAITTGLVALAAGGWALYTVATTSSIVSTIALASAIEGTSVVMTVLTTVAEAAWVAITGPVGLAIIGITALGVAIYEIVKHWDEIKIATYGAIAAALEYAAKAASVFSDKTANALKNEAQAFRDKATAIKESSKAITDASNLEAQQAAQRQAKEKAEKDAIQRQNAEKLAIEKEYQTKLSATQQETNLDLQEVQSAHNEKMLQIDGKFGLDDLETRLKFEAEELARRQAIEQQVLQATTQSELAKANAVKDAEERKKAIRTAGDKAALEQAKLSGKQQVETAKQSAKSEELIEQTKVAARRDTLSTIATLQNSNNKTLATIGKAAGITEIAIDTPIAVSKALAAFPPPFNFAAAALVGTAMAAQAAKIAGVQFADGGIVPGASFSGDRISARLNSGEMILNAGQQANLFKIANGNGTSGLDLSSINDKLDQVIAAIRQTPVNVQVGGKTIMDTLRDEFRSGRALNVPIR